MNTETRQRIQSIDVLRGLVMVIMLLDHIRDYFHGGANTGDPLDLATTTPELFFTRWVTHFCAPIFIFLSGVSAYLQTKKHGRHQLSLFLLKRGLWLILAEFSIVAFAWTFDPGFHFIPLQVIWAIGISMVFLGFLIWLKLKDHWILILGILITCTHNLLDPIEAAEHFKSNFWWDLLHRGNFAMYHLSENHRIAIVYPFLPWLGLMMIGYGMGRIFNAALNADTRKKDLMAVSAICMAVLIVLRGFDLYGDPHPWHFQSTWYNTVFDFVKLNKYPPSLLFVLMTIGAGLFLLSVFEQMENRFTRVMTVYGRTAFFFYILHLYLVHFLTMLLYFLNGHKLSELDNLGGKFPFLFVVPGEGFGLLGVYGVWLFCAISLYPVCKWYDQFKRNHPEKNWLKYL